jgi:hypothetical protein
VPNEPAPAIRAAELEDGSKLTFDIAPRVAAMAGAEELPPPPPRTTSWPCARDAGFQLAPKPDDNGALWLPCVLNDSQSAPESAATEGWAVAGIETELEKPVLPAAGTIRSGTRF